MFKRQLTLALAALVAVAACAPPASAQSGRRAGRGPSARGLSGREAVRDDAALKAGEVESDAKEKAGRSVDFDLRSLNAGRSAPVVYAEDGDKHPDKGDKVVGVILLGYLILNVWVLTKSDGYAPGGHGPRAGDLRLHD